jgi:hypothetical protein
MHTPYQNPVTRLTVAHVELSNGTKFSLVHDLDQAIWARLLDRWKRKASTLTQASLIFWVKDRRPHCICVSKKDFDEITAGKSVPATKEEYEAENPK